MPNLDDLTQNERAWIGFLRLISNDTDPAPTVAKVQGMRFLFSNRSVNWINAIQGDP